jgi:hypothetical protein
MNFRQIISIGSVAAGLMCTGGYAQASDSTQGVNPSGAVLLAQGSTGGSTGSGGSSDGPYRGVADLSVPGGTRDPNKSSGANMDAGKGRQTGETDNGPSGTSGSNMGRTSGGSSSSGGSSGSGSSSMGSTSTGLSSGSGAGSR